MDPWAVVEEKYHLVVTAGYSLVIAVIVAVLKASAVEHMALWLFGVIFFAFVLRGTRKGVDAPPKFEV